MSTKRKLLALGLCAGVLALSSALAVQAFPLVAPAEATTSDDRPVAEGVAGGVPGGVVGGVVGGVQDEPKKAPPEKKSGRKLVYKVNPGFPEGGRKVKAREDVVLSVTIEKSGEISDVKVIKGHPSFNESAVEAVKQWKFEPSEQSPAEATITIRFVPPPPPPPPPKPER